MILTPVVSPPSKAAKEFVLQLQQAGLAAELVDPRDIRTIPQATHFIVWDEPGVPVSHQWHSIVPRHVLERSITCGQSIHGKDIVRLDELRIRYTCNSKPTLTPLLRLIGTLDAEAISQSQARIAKANLVATSLFQATSGTFGLFATATDFDQAFFHGLSEQFAETIKATPIVLLMEAISSNHDSTIQHCSLVTAITVLFGGKLGLPATELERLFFAALFHDIGKSVIPTTIIEKPGKLTDEEMRLMRSHVTVGYDMLRRFPQTAGEIAEVALSHHELLDGSGYPSGLRGPEISDLIRIITICDVFAALIERRAYKPAMPAADAYRILVEMGPKLDQDLVSLFSSVASAMA